MKTRYMTWTLAFLVGLCAGMSLAFWLTRYRRIALPCPRVSVESVNGRKAILISVDEHPPWAHSHIYDVAINYDSKIIDITEFYVPFHLFSPHIWDRPPIVIQEHLPPGSYTLRFWDGKQYVEMGRVSVEKKGITEWDLEDSGTN